MSKDSSRLSRVGVLAPAALSACMDASVLAVPAAGAIVSTVLKELSKAFMLKKWFHGIMSAKEAEHLIMEKGRNGSFLVRESLTHPGEYVLSVRVHARVSHVMIRRQQNKYDVGSGEQFDDLVGLIEHFRSYPMIENSGDVLRLLQPVSGTCIRPRDIEHKIKHWDIHKLNETCILHSVLRCCKNLGTKDITFYQEMDEFQKPDYTKGVDVEFHSLKTIDDKHVSTSEGMKIENAKKNRYRNILPYDQTRVILSKRKEHNESDYINASYIRPGKLVDSTASVDSSNESLNSVHSLILRNEPKKNIPLVSKSLSEDALREVKRRIKMDKTNGLRTKVLNKVYIATQGCLSNTTEDFWRMIWQEEVRVIAMITNEVEKGKKKCERYWPAVGHEEIYDELTVKCMAETFYEDYCIREFDVSDKIKCRTIYQYQFTTWPDHGTPVEPDGVLAFIEEINRRLYFIRQEKNAPEQNIICVHCSAGVGRTGTFIVLDMLIDKIIMSEFNSEMDVQNTVKLVRSQRSGMVQNKVQYRFIYLAVQNYIDSKPFKLRKKVYTSEA